MCYLGVCIYVFIVIRVRGIRGRYYSDSMPVNITNMECVVRKMMKMMGALILVWIVSTFPIAFGPLRYHSSGDKDDDDDEV